VSKNRRPPPPDELPGSSADKLQFRVRDAVSSSGNLDLGPLIAEILRLPDPLSFSDELCALAEERATVGDNGGRIGLLEMARSVREAQPDVDASGLAGVLDALSRAWCAEGEYDAARPYATRSLKLREKNLGPYHADTARSLDRLGEIEFGKNNLKAAHAHYSRSLTIRRRRLGSEHPLTANSLNNLACVYAQRGDQTKATSAFEKILSMKSRALGDAHPDLLVLLENLAVMYRNAGRFDKARICSERGVAIGELVYGADHPSVADVLASLGEAYRGLGRYQDAHAAAQRALTIRTSSLGDSHPSTAIAKTLFAAIVSDIGDISCAQQMLQSAVDIFRRTSTPTPDPMALALYHLGLSHGELGELETARSLLEEALTLYRWGSRERESAIVLLNLAVVYRGLGDYVVALNLLNEAVKIQRRVLGEVNRDVARSLIEIGRDWNALGNSRRAINSILGGAVIACCCDDPQSMALAFEAIAVIFRDNYRAIAILFGKLSVNLTQTLRAGVSGLGSRLEQAFLDTRETRYRTLGESLIISGRLPEAQQVLTMLKETELFELGIRGTDPRTTRATLTPLETTWDRKGAHLRGNLVRSFDKIARRREDVPASKYRALVARELRRGRANLKQWLEGVIADVGASEAKRSSLKETLGSEKAVSQAQRKGVAFLQYLIAADRLHIIATLSDRQHEYCIPLSEGELHRLVYAMRSSLHERSDAFHESARRLYNLLVAPVVDHLRAAATRSLMLSLDGVLRYVPVSALHDGKRYLVEDFSIALGTGAASRGQTSRPPLPHAAGLGVSRAIGEHSPLHGVREELDAVICVDRGGGILPGVIRLDEDFTADALRDAASGRYAVLHLASHFVFSAAQEASSYLLLGDGSRLTLADLSKFRFHGIDLMTLSACDTATGGGHRQSGREVEGLGALARHQGARNVVATLWPVADRTTAPLMGTFYRNMYVKGMGAADALRDAQLMLLNGAAQSERLNRLRGLIDPDDPAHQQAIASCHPYYWAPYILMGGAAEHRKR
jgi:CHAT domain-containing protein/tetratricopeptide (TPR) repeat protein